MLKIWWIWKIEIWSEELVDGYTFRVQTRQACWARAILDINSLEIVYSLNFLKTIDLMTDYYGAGSVSNLF